jgi:putative nucleotidyltransferase with HDIG domain
MNSDKLNAGFQDAVARKIHDERLRILNPVKRYLDGVVNLPPAPMLVTDLLALFGKSDCDIDQVVEMISYEPSLTAQILRDSNSVFFGGEQPSADIFEAVTRLGFYQVYCMVVSLVGSRTKSMEGAGKGLNVDQLWRHSVSAAVGASVVAEDAGQTKAVAFTAGLLHDIGKLVLASSEKEAYARAIQKAREQGVLLCAVERSVFVIDHAELGGELMQRWKLPEDIAAAVRYHHDLDGAGPHKTLTAVVQVGDMIAHQLNGEDLAATDLLIPPTAALDGLQITPERLSQYVAEAQAEVEKIKGMLEV